MGHQLTYVRRKQDAECFNGEEHERATFKKLCACSEMDFECDVGYQKSKEGGNTCVKIESEDPDKQDKPLKGGLTEE